MDVVTAKHGYDLLSQHMTLTEKAVDVRVSELQRAVDRHLTERQVQAGRSQVLFSKWNLVVAVGAAVASTVITLIVSGAF